MNNLDKYRSLLKEGEGLLLSSRYSRYYGCGCDIAEGMAVVGLNGCRYFTDSRYIEAAQNGIETMEVVEMNRGNPYGALINKACEDFGITKLGVEDQYMTLSEFNGLKEKLTAELVPMSDEINSFRAVKADWELTYMKKAQEITDKTFTEILTKIKAGMTEKELMAELIYLMYKNGGEGLSFDPIVVSGPNTSLPHGVATDRVIREGDFITMDFGVYYKGYCSDMTRTVAVGFVTEEMEKVYNTVLAAQTAAIAATKAGVTGADIDGVARRVITEAGYGPYFGHGYGHSLGMECHEMPSCSPSAKTPMEVNMVTSAEPGIYLPGKFGVRIEDVVVVTADGCVDITESPKNLIIV